MKALLEYNPHNGIPKLKPLTTLIESLKRKYISDKSSIESYAESHDLNMIKNENESIKLPMIPQLTQTKKSKTDSHESNNLITTQNLSSEDCKFIILNIFIQSSHYTILHLLRNPQTREINVNLVIDKHGHSSIHYACQLGNIRLLKCLIEEGGDVLLGNYWGETGLIRSITTAANYDLRVFPETLALLSKSVFSVDLKRHTILHHLSFLGGQPKRVKQVTYYLQCLSASLCKLNHPYF